MESVGLDKTASAAERMSSVGSREGLGHPRRKLISLLWCSFGAGFAAVPSSATAAVVFEAIFLSTMAERGGMRPGRSDLRGLGTTDRAARIGGCGANAGRRKRTDAVMKLISDYSKPNLMVLFFDEVPMIACDRNVRDHFHTCCVHDARELFGTLRRDGLRVMSSWPISRRRCWTLYSTSGQDI